MKRLPLAAAALLACLTAAAAPSSGAEQGQFPLRVRLDAPSEPSEAGLPVRVTITVEADPDQADSPAPAGEMTLRLRLPPGVDVAAPEWRRTAAPEEDATGTWTIFEKRLPSPAPGAPEGVLAQESLPMSVTQEGLNWVITLQAQLFSGGALQGSATGATFATRQGKQAQFHAVPRKL